MYFTCFTDDLKRIFSYHWIRSLSRNYVAVTKIWKNYKPASKSLTPVPPRALGELTGRLKNYHHTTVVWSMGTVCPEVWQLLQPYCIQCWQS